MGLLIHSQRQVKDEICVFFPFFCAIGFGNSDVFYFMFRSFSDADEILAFSCCSVIGFW